MCFSGVRKRLYEGRISSQVKFALFAGFFESVVTDGFDKKALSFFKRMIEFPRRYGEPTEFAALCKSVCENPMINGETVRLDGALRLHY